MSKETTNSNAPATTADDAVKTPNLETPANDDAANAAAVAAAAATPAGDNKPVEKSFSKADLDKEIAKAVKAAEKKAADAEAKAKLSDDERAKAETDELRSQLRERDARDAVKDEAAKLGVKNPAAIYRIVAGDLEYDDKGNISNLADVLESAKADFPELFDTKPSQSIDGGAGTSNAQGTLTKEMLAKMTPSEINALDWNAVQKVLTAK